MVRIIRAHGLRAGPVDIDPQTLAPHLRMLESAHTSRTRVLLVAYLFGGPMDVGPVAGFAREHGLILVEDCAQAFQGPEAVGDPATDVSMYGFGILKTSTALGSAVLRAARAVLRVARCRARYPGQRRGPRVFAPGAGVLPASQAVALCAAARDARPAVEDLMGDGWSGGPRQVSGSRAGCG
jgi:dTDP-4-amino-4,6-dideoxygalactose transaminase